MTRVAEVSEADGGDEVTRGVSNSGACVLLLLLAPAEGRISDVNSKASMEGCGAKIVREA